MEVFEGGVEGFFIDEDMSASNFLGCDFWM